MFDNRLIRITFFLFCFFLQYFALYADNSVREMVLSASGVNENDIASASSKKSISLYDAFVLSVRNTENLSISGENVIQAKSKYSQAVGAYMPEISLNAVKSYSDPGSGSKKSYSSTYIYGRQPVITGLNEWAFIYQSKSSASVSYKTLMLSAQQLLLNVAQKYYLVCQLQSTLDTDREIVDLYKKIRAELARRVAVGKNRRNDVLRTDGQISRLEAEFASVSSQLQTAKSELALTAGLSASVSVSGGLNLPPPAYRSDDIRSIISRRLEVVISKENVDIANFNLNGALGGHLPSIYLDGSYRFYSHGDDPNDKYNMAITASLPIFQGGITSEKVSQAESVKRQADLTLAQTMREVEKDIVSSYDTWDGFVKQTNAYKKALESAERNYDMTMNDYRLSLVTIIDVISVLTELQQARNDYKTAMFSLELSRIKLGVAIYEFPGSGNSLLKNIYMPGTDKAQ